MKRYIKSFNVILADEDFIADEGCSPYYDHKYRINGSDESNYVDTAIRVVEKYLRIFKSIDGGLLKKAISNIQDEWDAQGHQPFSGDRFVDGSDGLSIELTGNLRYDDIDMLYDSYKNGLNNLEVMLAVLRGNTNFKSMWMHKLVYGNYHGEVKVKNNDSEWKSYVNVINQALKACNGYWKDIEDECLYSGYYVDPEDSEIIRTINDMITSGSSYKKTLEDLDDILESTVGDYEEIADAYGRDGGLLVRIGKSTRTLNANTVKSKINRYLQSNRDRYPEIELKGSYSTDGILYVYFDVGI